MHAENTEIDPAQIALRYLATTDPRPTVRGLMGALRCSQAATYRVLRQLRDAGHIREGEHGEPAYVPTVDGLRVAGMPNIPAPARKPRVAPERCYLRNASERRDVMAACDLLGCTPTELLVLAARSYTRPLPVLAQARTELDAIIAELAAE